MNALGIFGRPLRLLRSNMVDERPMGSRTPRNREYHLALNSGFLCLFTMGGGPSLSEYGSLRFPFGLGK